jgi:hypothetical protein
MAEKKIITMVQLVLVEEAREDGVFLAVSRVTLVGILCIAFVILRFISLDNIVSVPESYELI